MYRIGKYRRYPDIEAMEDRAIFHKPFSIEEEVKQLSGKTYWNQRLCFIELNTGCGTMSVYGLGSVRHAGGFNISVNRLLEQLDLAFSHTSTWINPVALIVGTLGGSYWSYCEKIILSCGFVMAHDYLNIAHKNCKDRQRMYFLDVDKYQKCRKVVKNMLSINDKKVSVKKEVLTF